MIKHFAAAGFCLVIGACASFSPRADVEQSFVNFGLSPARSACLAEELDERLDRDDMAGVAQYVDGLNAAASPGQALDALINIDNPRAAAAIGAAGISCAFPRDR